MDALEVFYDERCAFCRRCRDWLASEPQRVQLTLTPQRSGQGELVVRSSSGEVWEGEAAFIVCLWALERYRPWSVRLSSPAMWPLARRAFAVLSSQRHLLGTWLLGVSDQTLAAQLARLGPEPPRCSDGAACAAPRTQR